MNLIPFYRLADKQNRGPYNDSAPRVLPGTSSPQHPSPRLDGLDLGWIVLRQHLFGFQSTAQLDAWMTTEILTALEEAAPDNYRITEYLLDARIVHHGGHQSIALKAAIEDCFRTREATLPEYLAGKRPWLPTASVAYPQYAAPRASLNPWDWA